MHHHSVLVNAQVAHVLRCAPWLITRAADAYYNRSPEQVAALMGPSAGGKGKGRFLFNSDDERLVRYRARFTRCSFAQLVLQEPTAFPAARGLYPDILSALPAAGALRRPLLGFLGLGTAFNALMLFWFAEAVGKALGLVTWDSGVSSGSAKTE